MSRLDSAIVRHQIENLKQTCPEAWENGEEALLLDMLEAETNLNEFMRVIVDRMRDDSSMAGAIEERIAELQIRQERYEQREKAMRELALKLMQAAGTKKLPLPEATLSVRPVPPKVVITNEADLPDIACKFTRKPDLAKIKELLTDSTGMCAGATMTYGGETLSVRVK